MTASSHARSMSTARSAPVGSRSRTTLSRKSKRASVAGLAILKRLGRNLPVVRTHVHVRQQGTITPGPTVRVDLSRSIKQAVQVACRHTGLRAHAGDGLAVEVQAHGLGSRPEDGAA